MTRVNMKVGFAVAGLFVAALVGCGSSDSPAPAGTAGAAGSAGSAGAGGSAGGGGAMNVFTACTDPTKGNGVVKSVSGKCSEEMFCKYGAAAFGVVNDNIIKRATAAGIEADIGDTFKTLVASTDPMKVPAFKANLGTFLVNVYGGDPKTYPYKGSDMKSAHAGLKITSAQYDAFVSKVVVPALMDSGVAMADITGCFAGPVTDPAFKAMIAP